jgi:hypothetical protein
VPKQSSYLLRRTVRIANVAASSGKPAYRPSANGQRRWPTRPPNTIGIKPRKFTQHFMWGRLLTATTPLPVKSGSMEGTAVAKNLVEIL